MKIISAVTALILLTYISLLSTSLPPISISNTPSDSLDFAYMEFLNGDTDYISVLIFGQMGDYAVTGKIIGGSIGFEKDSTIYNFDEIQYQRVYLETFINNIENNNTILLEARDTSNTEAIGFIYVARNYIATQLSPGLIDSIENQVYPVWDSLDSTNGFTDIYRPDLTEAVRNSGDAYIISFDQPDTYESGYTLAELDYEYIYQNSATDYLEKILDTDRNNELVGFRYYSDLNGQEYIIFIKANN